MFLLEMILDKFLFISTNLNQRKLSNSSYVRGKKAEEIAKEWLQKKFGVPFSERSLQIGWKSDGKPVMHNFDLVSADCQIIVEVKSHQLTKGGNIPSGKLSDTYQACSMLEKVSAINKFLLLTDREFYQIFKRYSDGKISNDIELVLLTDERLCQVNDSKAIPSPIKTACSKETSFDIFWSELTSWFLKKQYIKNWTLLKGNTGEDFNAIYLGGNYIIAYPKSAGEQKISKNDFKMFNDHWDGYVAGIIPRSHFVRGPIAKSRFAKYIISIIHQFKQ